jgi:hypothetical protein
MHHNGALYWHQFAATTPDTAKRDVFTQKLSCKPLFFMILLNYQVISPDILKIGSKFAVSIGDERHKPVTNNSG